MSLWKSKAVSDNADIKAKAAMRWTAAVKRLGAHGRWSDVPLADPARMMAELNRYTDARWGAGAGELG